MEWGPTVLKNLDPDSDDDDVVRTLLQEVMSDTDYPIETVRLVLRAGLKHLPHELGLLLLETQEHASV